MEALHPAHRVRRRTEHHRAEPLVVGHVVAHAARLRRAAGRIRLGVEVEDNRLAAQRRQSDRLPVLIWEFEVRGLITDL